VSDPQRLSVTGKRRDFMPELQRLPNEFAARATRGAKYNEFHPMILM
jgi:hypothetical protein